MAVGDGGGRGSRRPARWIALFAAVLIAATAGTLTVGSLGAGVACACSCAPQEPQELVEGATVAVGRVLEVDEEPTGGRDPLAVEHSYGTELPSYVVVNTASPNGACGFFPPRDELIAIVIGARSGPSLDVPAGEVSASLCENAGVDVAMAARYGGQLYRPIPVARRSLDAPADWFGRSRVILVVALGGVVLAVLVAGVVLLRRSRTV